MKDCEKSVLFPIFIDLAGKHCIVVGGGEVAARKISSLLDAGARVQVVAPKVCESLQALLERPGVNHTHREYQSGDLKGSALVFAATDSPDVNAAVYREAESLEILVNVVDDPTHCSFIVPSCIDRNPICIAISTQGASPALARHLRERIEEAVPPEYQRLAQLLGRLRGEVIAAHSPAEQRKARWQQVLASDVLSLLREGKDSEAEATARELLGIPPRKENE
ncbi:MAG: bifunctional precorrin-2 dehydrogenase/sirohydrochlorin ferrochelatase [Armatimonadetes bacterium]|nr:bifunctional precorrin-2 dehydrogenase/sirohydrochlorin ferrochelatase [Armatimonadota bacterium]NIM23431.1 bifunctional precorrin-2 dehydrogenase/sirohydrochlorin ferrochelatase [Armatimonadota bacterium]NIM67296.1 bifunctional precorrin-2 dehydrogenase/sirohydrochlorin ferrochelatase [Armatimonadota bacterium]NIM75794.1 bifunctional precorrin-2 dehydrogenase/sirohydrochlorin ferrochelatase [Armatimonadota bacterium]NIN05482.1 bifunctional precorrin-2 dehydrogenase/sirohydrochlorin ferroche